MNTKEYTKTIDFNGEELIFKTGKLALRAESTVLAQLGGTVVFAVVSKSEEDTDLDYFPLTVEYIEKYYAGGVISGSRFLKRERRPSDEAVLKARQIDHSIRSLFPKGFKKSVDVIVTVLAYDTVHDPEVLAVTSASMALMLSSLPFDGPSASVKVGVKDGELVLNPTADAKDSLDGDFIVSVRGDRVLNIEGYGDEIPEETMGKLLDFAVENCKPLLKVQEELTGEIGRKKIKVEDLSAPEDLIEIVKSKYSEQVTKALYNRDERQAITSEIITEIRETNEELKKGDIYEAIEYVARGIMREAVLAEEKRTSGRALDEVRDLEIEVGVLPRVHGSALFRRGMTQCLSVVTLGSTRLVQTLESFEGEEEKRFMHHYNGPRYSLGEAGRFMYYPGRREIGHGAIGENALRKMIPSKEDFPYTIRVVSEILSQRGSSSMAASCGTTLALMDAGVQIKSPVGGVSVGLVTEENNEDKYKLLVDIEDVEDFYGDMDFKVTGTKDGVTAIQLDNKLKGVPVSILKEAFTACKKARLEILEAMVAVIPAPRAQLNEYAPKVEKIHINKERIGEVIGPGGKMIKSILEEIGGDIDINIEDDGLVMISSMDRDKIARAREKIKYIVMEPELGKVYEGVVDKLTEYGAFVDVSPSISGLLHISEMSESFVKDPSTIVKEGQEVKVKIIKLENGRISFSLKGIEQ